MGCSWKGATALPITQPAFVGNLELNYSQKTCFWVKVLRVAKKLPCSNPLKVSPQHKNL